MPPALQGWVVHRVAPDVLARIMGEQEPLSPDLQTQIGALWDAAQARAGGALFNGLVFSVDEITPRLLSGHMAEFRHVLAQMERPELHEALRVRPLAVCGVLSCQGGLVVGRRSARAVYQPAMWQLPPAGSVDAGALRSDGSLDLRGQLLRELHEELGLPPDSVAELLPVCMIEHPGSHVLDLGFWIRTRLATTEVLAAHARAGNDEYQDIEVIPLSDVSARM